MSPFDIVLLVAAGLVGGAANALAGGGTFFTFPAMLEAAGAAFMVMAGNAVTGIEDVRKNVALKNLVITVMTTVSVIVFVAAGAIAWRETLMMMLGALPGGYLGARLAQRLDAATLRRFIIAVGVALTLYYFWKV